MKGLLTGTDQWSQFEQPVRKLNYQILLAAAAAAGISASVVSWLEPSCNGIQLEVERRKAELVQSYINAIQVGIPLEDSLAATDCTFPAFGTLESNNSFLANWNLTELTGGTSVALDSIPTVDLADGTIVVVSSGTTGFSYYRLITATSAEASPGVIRADDYSASNTRIWVLQNVNQPGFIDMTITATVGAVTISKYAGTAIIAAGASSVTVTNILATQASDYIVFASLRATDATATFIRAIVPGTGSFVINVNANATANTAVQWQLIRRIGS